MVETADRFGRLAHVCAVAGLHPTSSPRLIDTYSNDVWLFDDLRVGSVVLRVSWRGDVTRLEREAAVAAAMPSDIPYPRILDHGRGQLRDLPLTYMLTRQLAGNGLGTCWDALWNSQRRSAASQLAAATHTLHSWTPPPKVAKIVCTRPGRMDDTIDGLIGADILPLPIPRALRLAEHAATLRFVDAGLLSAAAETLIGMTSLDPGMDDPDRHSLLHGDLHLSNLWWTTSDVLTVLDLEWTRFGPPSIELQRLCDNADDDVRRGDDTHPAILRQLEADYPELFRGDNMAARIRLYSLAFAIRQIVISPPDRPTEGLAADHPFNRLRRIVDDQWPQPGSLPASLTTN